MMPPPERREQVDSDELRGNCPRCGSGEIVQLVIGVPSGAEVMGGGPDWLRWVGCDHPGYDRECRACDHAWLAAVDPPQYPHVSLSQDERGCGRP